MTSFGFPYRPAARAVAALFLAAACLVCLTVPAGAGAIPAMDVPLGTAAVRTPTTGATSVGNDKVTIDTSNTSEGYVMVRFQGGGSKKIMMQITQTGGSAYTYQLKTNGVYEAFPFTAGNGQYTIQIFENVSGTKYAQLYSTTVQVSLRHYMLPYLYPNQYVSFNASSAAVRQAETLARGASSKAQVVANVYNYVVNNVSYDANKAYQAQSGQLAGYLPNVDSTLATRKGICFDYAVLMAAMLRSQQIPTQLHIGYVSGGVYHAWINVYIDEVGWVNGVIYFDGTRWTLMDPTLASSNNQSKEIMQYIGNGGNYRTVYIY